MNPDSITLSRKALTSLVNLLVTGRPNPVEPDPDPPWGPWGPVIRTTIERFRWSGGPQPDPWVQVGLNPQPLPPRTAFAVGLAQGIADQALSLAGPIGRLSGGNSDPEAAAGELLERFIDDCDSGRIRFPRKWWPFPWPPRRDSLPDELTPAELVIAGVQLTNAAGLAEEGWLRHNLEESGTRLMEIGLDRM